MTQEALPSRMGASDLIDFVEKVVYNPGSSESEVKKRIHNANEIAALKRCALLFHFISEEEDSIHPTDLAKRFVYAEQSERKKIMLDEVILPFELYSIPLEHAIYDRSEPFSLTSTDFQKHWTVNSGLKLSKDTLDKSANTMFKLLEFAGLGSYCIGRRGKPTRLEISSDGLELIHDVFNRQKEAKKKMILSDSEEIISKEYTEIQDLKPVPHQPIITSSTTIKPQQYQTHVSKDGTVILKIVPSEKSIKFLELIIPVLKLELDEADTD